MVTFNFSFAPGTTVQQMVGFETAGRIWSSYLTDNVTLNIHVAMSNSLPQDVIGGALPGMRARQSYLGFRDRLLADRTSQDDWVAGNHLQDDEDKFTALVDGFKIDNNYRLNMTRANAKALGLLNGMDTGLDGFILMSNLSNAGNVTWSYDYQRTGTATANTLDFLSTAIHEIGHILGFVSGVDKQGWLTQRASYTANMLDDYYSSLVGQLSHATPLDMFRFSSQSALDNWIDLSVGGNPYFSLDGGRTSLANFATGLDTGLGGDGFQASHWKDTGTNSWGVMDPTLTTGQRVSLSSFDLRSLDVIGWNLRSTGISTVVDLSALVTETQQVLASRVGQTTTWLNSNLASSPGSLTRNQDTAIAAMVVNSQIYHWDWSDGSPFWQKLVNLFRMEGHFSTQAQLLSETGNELTGVVSPNLFSSEMQPFGAVMPNWDWGEGSIPWVVIPGVLDGDAMPNWGWGEGSMPWIVIPEVSDINAAGGSLNEASGIASLPQQYWSDPVSNGVGVDSLASGVSFAQDAWAWDWNGFG